MDVLPENLIAVHLKSDAVYGTDVTLEDLLEVVEAHSLVKFLLKFHFLVILGGGMIVRIVGWPSHIFLPQGVT